MSVGGQAFHASSENEDNKEIDFFDTINYSDKFSIADAKKVYKSNAVAELKSLIAKTTSLERYKVGDILVRKRWNTGVNYETMNDGVTKTKYEVVYITDEGMVFAKKYLQCGQLGCQVFCLNTDSHRYEIDPDLIDHILLDEEDLYDPTEYLNSMMKKKKDVQEKNRKSAIKLNTKKGRNYLLASFNVADTLWHSWGMMGQGATEYKVTHKDATIIVLKKVNMSSYYHNRQITVHKDKSIAYNFWEQKPIEIKEAI